MSQFFVAKVKNVISGDTLILVPSKTTQLPAPERLLTLSYVRSDDYETKEYLRNLLIGKEIKFKVEYKNQGGREFGDVQAPIFKSLIIHLLSKGLVKLKDNVSENDGDVYYELQEAENSAKLNSLGVWGKQNHVEVVALDEEIITKSQKTPLKVVVEKVISGDRVMARIIMKNSHVTTPLLLAGIKTPRTDDTNQAAQITKVAQQAKAFVEEKLLTTKAELTVSIIGHSQNDVPVGIINHESGNDIHLKLLELGYAEIVDWQSTLVGSKIMGGYRKAEQTARALGKGLFASTTGSTPKTAKIAGSSLKPGATIENVQIARVVGADTLVIRLPSDEELTVQLASVRAPRPGDSTVTSSHAHQQALVATAREFVRHLVIGKTGTLYIDGYRNENKELNFDARFLVSFKYNNTDLSEVIVSNGFGTVIKHNKATAHERSSNWDRLVEIEEEQKKLGKKGVYFSGDINKILTVGTRVVDASENAVKARTFLNGFKQKGRISGGYHVEFIPSMNRVKLFNPKEGLKLTLILGGLTNDKSESLSEQGLKFMNKKFLQRNVEFEVYDADKIGGFVGNLYATSKSLIPVQVMLLEQGLCKVHDSVHSNQFAGDFIKAEELAKSGKKGVWSNYDEGKVQAELAQTEGKLRAMTLEAAKPKFFDVEVVDIDNSGVISFHMLDAATLQKFASFKSQFATFHSQAPSASTTSVDLPYNLVKPPKKGELVSAKFSENSKYYRGRVISYDKTTGKYQVLHLDFGNIDKVPLSSLRSLPAKFNLTSYPSFAHTSTLQNVKLPPSSPTDYLTEALEVLDELTFEKKLVISALPSSGNVEYEGVFYDAKNSLTDPTYTINKQLVVEGFGVVDPATTNPALKSYVGELVAAQAKAKSQHLGCWEFGDVSFEDEPLY